MLHQDNAPAEIRTKLDYQENCVLVMGSPRCGKTELVSRYVRLHPARKIFLFDAEQKEFARRLRVPCAINENELSILLETQKFICYDPEEEFGSDFEAGLDWYLTYVWEVCRLIPGRKLVVVDELHKYIDPQNMVQPLTDILARGGRYQIDKILIGSQPNMLHNEVRNKVTEIISFRMVDETATRYLKSLKFDVNRVMELPPFCFLHKHIYDSDVTEHQLKF